MDKRHPSRPLDLQTHELGSSDYPHYSLLTLLHCFHSRTLSGHLTPMIPAFTPDTDLNMPQPLVSSSYHSYLFTDPKINFMYSLELIVMLASTYTN